MSEGTPLTQPCCDGWAKAHEWGTDNEGYGSLVYCFDGTRIGLELEPVRFCPWCGAGKDGNALSEEGSRG